MIFSEIVSARIVSTAYTYLGRAYDWRTFDCCHFIIAVYRDAGIHIPRFGPSGYPPADFHLSLDEFGRMPLGHSVFLKRKASPSNRIWTHMAIIISPTEFIHCSRHFGSKVTITSKIDFIETYALAPKA